MSSDHTAGRTEFVYLIGSEAGPLVKIGRTIDLPGRFADIQRMSPVPLTLLWQTEGGAELEAALHRYFKTCRSHGEWFDFPEGDALERVQRAVPIVIAEAERRRLVLRAMRKTRKLRRVWTAPAVQRCAPSGQPPHKLLAYNSDEIAEFYRQDIWGGQYAHGDVLPRVLDVAATFNADRKVVLAAYRSLADEGLVEVRRRAGTVVIFDGSLLEAGGPEDERRRLDTSPTNTCLMSAPAEVAEALNVPNGTEVIERMWLICDAQGRAIQSLTSWSRTDAATGPREVEVSGWPRKPLPAEAETLGIPRAVPVVDVTKLVTADEQVVEYVRGLYVGPRFHWPSQEVSPVT